MKPILSVEQMREVDRRAIGGDSTIGYRYMQKAGMGLFHAAKELVPNPVKGEIAIVCGKGNNGGDGYVAGRLLHDEGYRVMCFSLVSIDTLQNECLLAYNEYLACKGNLLVLDDIADFPHPSRFQLIIDALLGTGIKGDPHGLYAAIIDLINSGDTPVLAVDTPSGLNNDTGQPGTPCIAATVTVTMGFSKPGQYFYPGKQLTGRICVEDLNYPDEIVCTAGSDTYLPTKEYLQKIVPPRRPSGSKFDHGQALLVGGSPGMAGSITMMAEAALRCGCGMVHCGFPESLSEILSVKLTEPVLHALPQTEMGTLGSNVIDRLLLLAETMQALCIGPGLSHESDTTKLVHEIIRRCSLPTVLDADGINAFKGEADLLSQHAGDIVVTPHKREFERLFDALDDTPLERVKQLQKYAQQFNLTILLKGNPTLVAAPDGKVVFLPYGNSALAKAGSGDVLSGIITSFIAQGVPVTEAAILGGYIHATAGKIAAKQLNEYSVVARNVIDCIAQSMTTVL